VDITEHEDEMHAAISAESPRRNRTVSLAYSYGTPSHNAIITGHDNHSLPAEWEHSRHLLLRTGNCDSAHPQPNVHHHPDACGWGNLPSEPDPSRHRDKLAHPDAATNIYAAANRDGVSNRHAISHGHAQANCYPCSHPPNRNVPTHGYECAAAHVCIQSD